jgi:hypothetical protein
VVGKARREVFGITNVASYSKLKNAVTTVPEHAMMPGMVYCILVIPPWHF